MPSPTTALKLIGGAMRLFGGVSSGEEPTPEEASDALGILNDLLEGWSLEGLSVWGSSNQTFNVSAGVATYTIGVGGTFNTNRPVNIFDAYYNWSGVDFPVEIIDQIRYNNIKLKTQQQQLIKQLLYVNENPLGVITVWPVPSTSSALTLSCGRILTQVPDLATQLAYPPGYAKALRYALAVDLAPEFGKEVSSSVLGIAKTTKGAIKVANMTTPVMQFDGVLLDDGPATWQEGY